MRAGSRSGRNKTLGLPRRTDLAGRVYRQVVASTAECVIDRDITRKHTYANKSATELRQSCVRVEVAVLDSPSLIVLTVSLCERHVKQHQSSKEEEEIGHT